MGSRVWDSRVCVRVHAKSRSNRVPRVRYVLHLQTRFILQTTLWAKSCCHLCTWEALGAKGEDGWFPRMLRCRAVKSLGMLDQAWGELGPHMEEKRVVKRNTFVRGDARQEVPCLSPEGTCLNWLERNCQEWLTRAHPRWSLRKKEQSQSLWKPKNHCDP